MGYSSWKADDWTSYSSTTAAKPAAKIFTSRNLKDALDPTKFTIRESRDSDAHPVSTPVILAVDVTGSMGILAENLVKNDLGIVFQEILDRKPVTDPHLMVMALGDANSDSAPIQVSQFETDITITQQIEQIYVEGNGGGNNFESYDLPYYIAAMRTSTDSMEKRGKRGYLFTIGDEPPPPGLNRAQIERFTGDKVEADMKFADLIPITQRSYNCYHIIIAEGQHVRSRGIDAVKAPWQALLGQNVIVLKDMSALAQTIVSIMQVNEGTDVDTVTGSWSGTTAVAVKSAISDLAVVKKSENAVATL